MRLISETFEETTEGGIGASGLKIFSFQAASTGEQHLAFKYYQRWEGDKSIIEKFDIDVDVKE